MIKYSENRKIICLKMFIKFQENPGHALSLKNISINIKLYHKNS